MQVFMTQNSRFHITSKVSRIPRGNKLLDVLVMPILICIGLPLLIVIFIGGRIFSMLRWVFNIPRTDYYEKEWAFEWREFLAFDGLTIMRRDLSDEETPEKLVFPDHPDDIYIAEYKFTPSIPELEEKYFSATHCQDDQNFYCIAWGDEDNPMQLWMINKSNGTHKMVTDLDPQYWWLQFNEEEGVVLKARDSDKVYCITIEKNG